ncbi:DUF3168 domain-containing protein [Aliihoeflea sp. 40Bstr573]|uniref:DUF3168 domain-containing protein n=1 Tax=Aliihoeflea sp. 40Bstr573 TaxID=2696467 RepID=UPI002095BF7E|nr:DUF3168 domain-containing protein [Aliihoeflea sp. 40Bstr573]MCO6386353.1 DUF3168 domain-containing protein [Aliihoeflea sp. 40Bstr573]
MSAQAELQKLILDTLKADAAVMALANGAYDRVPSSPWGPDSINGYISFGPTDVVEDDADCIISGEHTVQIDCWSRQVGMVHAKRMVDAVKAALHEQELTLAESALVDMRVTMRRVVADPDGLTSHGIVMIRAMIEEVET